MNALHPRREPTAPPRAAAEAAPVPALDSLLTGTTARVTMADGKRVSGRVVKFDGPGRTLEFAWDGINPALPIAFSNLRAVEVLDSVEPFHRAGSRRCFVEFGDGTALALNAAMIAECGYGLFVFGPGRGSRLRWFFPSEAIAGFTVANTKTEVEEPGRRPRAGMGPGPEVCTLEQLREALERHRMMRHLRIGDALLQEGLITVEQRDAALAAQRSECHKQLGAILVESGALDPLQLRRVLVAQLGVPVANLDRLVPEEAALALLPAELARDYRVLPLRRAGVRLAVALEDPLDWATLKAVETITNLKIDPVLASRDPLDRALRRYYADGERHAA